MGSDMNKKKSYQNGSMVVEASIVVPVVILCVAAVIYIGLMLYQQANLQALADKAAERGEVFWNNKNKVVELGRLGKSDIGRYGLYWRLFDFDKTAKLKKLKGYVFPKLDDFNALNSISPNPDARTNIEIKDYIIYKKLVVTVEDTYRIPVGKVAGILGGQKEGLTAVARSETTLEDSVEFIRNTDFILDTERELEYKNPGLKNLGDKTRKIISDTRDQIVEFFKE